MMQQSLRATKEHLNKVKYSYYFNIRIDMHAKQQQLL